MTSFVFRAERPFHPKRLHDLVNAPGEVRAALPPCLASPLFVFFQCAVLTARQLENLIRSKGFVWLATRPRNCGVWGHAGNIFTIEKVRAARECHWRALTRGAAQGREWYATMAPDDWDVDDEEAKTLVAKMGTVWGDRCGARCVLPPLTVRLPTAARSSCSSAAR